MVTLPPAAGCRENDGRKGTTWKEEGGSKMGGNDTQSLNMDRFLLTEKFEEVGGRLNQYFDWQKDGEDK